MIRGAAGTGRREVRWWWWWWGGAGEGEGEGEGGGYEVE